MRTVAVIARKGGSGKTTVALNLAIAAHRRGLATVVADSDPQRSSLDLLKLRRDDGPRVVETSGRELYALQARSRGSGVDALIIDTPAAEEQQLSNALVLADLSLFVVRPTLVDFYSLARTLKVVKHLRKPAMVVLNQAPHTRAGLEPPSVRKAQQALALLRLPVSPAILRARAAYQSALESGCSAEEGTDEAAASEIEQLWSVIQRETFDRDHRPRPAESGLFVDDRPII
jgi:chromosome partitioning protein